MGANERQIGGDHYKTEYEHWDLVLATGMGYLEGCATKYVSRWRKKDGVLGLEKALHYVEKIQEITTPRTHPREHPVVIDSSGFRDEVTRFADANGLTAAEREIVSQLVHWNIAGWWETSGLSRAHKIITHLITHAEGYLPGPKPVPLTEENHYGERASKDN